jgi:hypothetical protein
MARTRLNYKEGDWVAVPLRDHGYAVGVIARKDGKGVVLGYFFKKRYDDLPNIADIPQETSASDACLVCMFGDLGIIKESWKIIGRHADWNREEWPVPIFSRIARDESWATGVLYSDVNIVRIREIPIDLSQARQLPVDGLSGYGAVEIKLTHLLSS